MIMPAPFFPGSSKEYENDKPLKRQEFIDALIELGNQRYHSLHPFHKLLHNGKLTFPQIQAWALNRFYYQWSIPRKDLTLMARINDVKLRLEWRSRVIDHEGDIDGVEESLDIYSYVKNLTLTWNMLNHVKGYFLQLDLP